MTPLGARSWETPFQAISEQINGRRSAVAESLLEALASLVDDWSPSPFWREEPKLRFAVAHHAIRAGHEAVRCNDVGRARAAVALMETTPRSVSTSIGRVIVADKAACVAGAEGQQFLTTATAPPAGLSDDEVSAAVDVVASTGLGAWLRRELAVAVLLGRVSDDSLTNAFSVATLPGTIFLEWTPLSARVGELLLHECGHSWLNEALDLFDEHLDGVERWYSPWKLRNRSAFGIVHAVVSFSLLIDYFSRLEHGSPNSAVVRFAHQRRLAETGRLLLVRPTALECIGQVRHETLRTFLQALLDEAVGVETAAEPA